MNLNKLFEIQAKLDERIIDEHGLQGEDLLDKKILALQVELGELANEWRGFKFWSKDQEPRTEEIVEGCTACMGLSYEANEQCEGCNGDGVIYKNPLLEEYVDCLHFILSIGLELNVKNTVFEPYKDDDITNLFIELNYQTYRVLQRYEWGKFKVKTEWRLLAQLFIGLGEMLGFSWEQIEQAYLAKNKINHERQNNGY